MIAKPGAKMATQSLLTKHWKRLTMSSASPMASQVIQKAKLSMATQESKAEVQELGKTEVGGRLAITTKMVSIVAIPEGQVALSEGEEAF